MVKNFTALTKKHLQTMRGKTKNKNFFFQSKKCGSVTLVLAFRFFRLTVTAVLAVNTEQVFLAQVLLEQNCRRIFDLQQKKAEKI